MKAFPSALTAALAFATLAAPLAAQITPQGTFGSLPQATFGGSGIPNNAVMMNTFGAGVTIGLTATQRFSAPAVTNNGAGTYFANAGVDSSSRALWNFDWFIGSSTGAGGAEAARYSYVLSYDMDPAAGNVNHGTMYGFFPSFPGYEGSENLTFAYLDANFAGFNTAPTAGPFDPNASGYYTFGLQAFLDQQLVGSVGIEVVVGSPTDVVPEPATMTLLATGLAGMAAAKRRKQAKAK